MRPALVLLLVSACSAPPSARGAACSAEGTWINGEIVSMQGTVDASGSCCVGCIDAGGKCVDQGCVSATECGNTTSCGHRGEACMDCDDGNVCTADSCGVSACVHLTLHNDAVCSLLGSAPGRCTVAADAPPVCCPAGACLSSGSCVTACPTGETCDPELGSCG